MGMDESEFWDCVEISLLRFRERIRDERKAEIERIKNRK